MASEATIAFYDPDIGVDREEVRQRFTMPDAYMLGENADTFAPRDPTITRVRPNLIGFGFLARIDQITPNSGDTDPAALDAVKFDWALVDRLGGDENVVRRGTYTGAINLTQCWIDVFFDPHDPVPTSTESRFEFRVGRNKNQDPSPFNLIYIQTPAPLSASASPVADNDIWIKTATTITEKTDYAMIYRVWADSGESGKDVLGNEYREGVRRDDVGRANDGNYLTSWVSQPNPDPTAVECLYFDVRSHDADTNALIPSIIDSVRVNPLWPGSYMHVYYSTEGVTVTGPPTKAPNTLDEWDQMLWSHVPQSYVLDKNQAYELPLPIRAAWIKLEFSNLQPIPFKVVDFPALPSVPYRQFPDLVSQDFVGPNRARNSTLRTTEDHFIQNNVRVKKSIFDAYRPDINDITYGKRYALGTSDTDINSTIFGPQPTTANLDPVTLGRIYYSSSQTNWGPNVLTQMDSYASVLGLRTQQIKNSALSAYSFEVMNPRGRPTSLQVSNRNDRTEDVIDIPDMYFSQTCRHFYKEMKAPFNGKAYAVGVRDVTFLRNDFTTVKDDALIHDGLADPISSPLIEFNSWFTNPSTTIPLGQTCYVTYDVIFPDGSTVTQYDETFQFEAPASSTLSFTPVPLEVGGGRAINVKLWTGPGLTGNFYSPGVDYTMVYDPDTFSNSIARNELHFRLTAI